VTAVSSEAEDSDGFDGVFAALELAELGFGVTMGVGLLADCARGPYSGSGEEDDLGPEADLNFAFALDEG
jgi:hypothetical protein